MLLEALVNAGGKGSRMGNCGIEKPMQIVGGMHTVQRVPYSCHHRDYWQ